MLDQYPKGLVSVVSDSYNILEAVEKYWCGSLKEKVLARDGALVIRPDSGDPLGNLRAILLLLEKAFGAEKNEKGYKVLNPKVRLIQADGVNPDSIEEILTAFVADGWSTDNIVFGMGGRLLQVVDRDTFKFAFKCSATQRDGDWHDVKKTSEGKQSKAGRFALVRTPCPVSGYHFDTVTEEQFKSDFNDPEDKAENMLRTVFTNGNLIEYESFSDIKRRLHG